jgi:hypothetical protein
MKVSKDAPSPKRITTAPAGRGSKPRPEIAVNADFVRRLLEEHRLTERDEELLKYLDLLGLLSTRQIKRLMWPGSSMSNMHRRLRQLYEYYLLDRARMVNKDEGITYVLGKAGRLWLHGETRGSSAPLVNLATLKHDLAVSEVFVLLVEELRRLDPDGSRGFEFYWRNKEQSRAIEKESQQVVIEPDASFRFGTDGIGVYTLYLELDMATESGAAFTDKVKHYHRAAWRQLLNDSPIRVLIATTSWERAENLANQIAAYQQGQKQVENFYWMTACRSELTAGIFGGVVYFGVEHDKVIRARLGTKLKAPALANKAS